MAQSHGRFYGLGFGCLGALLPIFFAGGIMMTVHERFHGLRSYLLAVLFLLLLPMSLVVIGSELWRLLRK